MRRAWDGRASSVDDALRGRVQSWVAKRRVSKRESSRNDDDTDSRRDGSISAETLPDERDKFLFDRFDRFDRSDTEVGVHAGSRNSSFSSIESVTPGGGGGGGDNDAPEKNDVERSVAKSSTAALEKVESGIDHYSNVAQSERGRELFDEKKVGEGADKESSADESDEEIRFLTPRANVPPPAKFEDKESSSSAAVVPLHIRAHRKVTAT